MTTVTTARGDKKADLTNGRAAKLNMTTGSRVQSLPRTSRCVAFEKSAYLQREPPPHPHHWFCLLSTSLLLIRAYTNFRPHTIFVSKQKVFGDFYFFVSVEGASFHGDNMVQCVTTAVVMRRGHSILFQERGDTFITGGFASRLMDTSV